MDMVYLEFERGSCCLGHVLHAFVSKGLVVKNLQVFNKALLSSLAWKILNDISFIFQFLRARSKGKLDAQFYRSSFIWLSTRDVISKIYKDCVWIIGKNSHLQFWTYNWTRTPITDLISLENFVWIPNLKVREYCFEGLSNLPMDLKIAYPNLSTTNEKVKISSNKINV